MATLAIKGHKTRGKEVIEILEMLGGKNSNHCTGFYINRIYFINKKGYIERKDDAKFLLYYSLYSLNEFKKSYPYVINDVVSRKCHPTIKFQISQMKWDDVEECVIYVLNNQLTARVDDLQPYQEETMEEDKKMLLGWVKESDNRMKLTTHKDYELKVEGNNVYLVKKKLTYPKTYEECCDILDIYPIYNKPNLCICEWHPKTREMHEHYSKLANLSQKDIAFMILRICRDAYWKIAGDWKEKRKEKAVHYVICSTMLGEVVKDTMPNCIANYLLDFPTEEMRDAFYENFKDLIEQCKELL